MLNNICEINISCFVFLFFPLLILFVLNVPVPFRFACMLVMFDLRSTHAFIINHSVSHFSSSSSSSTQLPSSSSPTSSSSSSSSSSTSTPSSSHTPPTLSIRHSMGNLFNGNTGYSLPNFATAITSCYPDNLSDE